MCNSLHQNVREAGLYFVLLYLNVAMHNDLTFITNDTGHSLKDRFQSLIKDTRFFDVLVGYFYTSGFYAIYPSLEATEKIRILIGISTNKQTYDLIQRTQSYKEITQEFGEAVKTELDESDNSHTVEEGVRKFLAWLQDGKLEIRAYPEEKIHSKLYIMTFQEDDRDVGRVITGSSNFTQNGLIDNLEFNVELKDPSDYQFAKQKFEELWEKGVDVSEKYIETIKKETWLREDITPYELYLKFLYEYFREEINEDAGLDHHYRPDNFKELKYQDHAVINAKKIIQEYNGVFLSDVVGLGKTFMGTMLCQELGLKTLVLAPPHLIDEHNQGSWENAFRNFGFRSRDYRCESIGKLDKLVERGDYQDFEVVLIDEAHRFRTEETETYSKLAQICKDKKVILVTATPYNNSPKDLLSQIKLFQSPRNSTLPGLRDLDGFFKTLENKLKGLDRQKDHDEYIAISKENAKAIRERVLKFLMVRRTRNEVITYYGEDLKKQKMHFPEVAEPCPIYYEFNEKEDEVFLKTLELVSTKFKYARYTPMLYSKGLKGDEATRQKNMMKFMRMLLVKRLESSFYAFQQSLKRFINSYNRFIEEYNSGTIYISKKHSQKVFEYLERGELERIDSLIEDGKAEKFGTKDFTDQFIIDLESDLNLLLEIETMWREIKRDPKILAFKAALQVEAPIRQGKSIIFTESQETAEYLSQELQKELEGVLVFSGASSAEERETVIENFDANARFKKNDYHYLVTTDVLSEGANLHQADVVINYDIPWNPTRIMQRVGRINRVGTKHTAIHTYTFFPTEQSNNQIKLREAAEAKIAAFITLLGADAKLLTENEEVEAHSLFSQLISKETIEGEVETDSELQYLQEIREIRDKKPELFERVKRLPKKSRSSRKGMSDHAKLLTYFRKGKLQKFFMVQADGLAISREIDFFEAAKTLRAPISEKNVAFQKGYYELLEKNTEMLEKVTDTFAEEVSMKRGGKDNAMRLANILRSKEVQYFVGFTEENEEYLARLIEELEDGNIPKKITQKTYAKIQETPEIIANPVKLLALLKLHIPQEFTEVRKLTSSSNQTASKEIILSEFFSPMSS